MDDKYFETYIDLFSTDGWKLFIEEVDEAVEANKEAILECADNNEIHFRRGYDW